MDEFRLGDRVSGHAVDTSVFLPFTIGRLIAGTRQNRATLDVELRNVLGEGVASRRLRVAWEADAIPRLPLGVTERTATEWAACGLASVLLSVYTESWLSGVAMDGDRFDYWVSDGVQDLALEVSGTVLENPERRHRLKVRQLLDNPYGIDGYVVVVGFRALQCIFSFERFRGTP